MAAATSPAALTAVTASRPSAAAATSAPVDLAGEPAESADWETVGEGVLGSLGSAAPSLAVAVEIERRALAIQEWPFDTAIIRTVAAILTSVTAVIIARFLLSQFGM